MVTDITYHQIASISDPHYDAWLDLYQTSFPLYEQMLVGSINRILRAKENGESLDDHLVAVLDKDSSVIAMAWYEVIRSCDAAALWYLSITPDARGTGIGTQVYGEIIRRVREESPLLNAILFEVEDPVNAHSLQDQEDARRRIAFYLRNGALLLDGIRYTQSVGWQPPVDMRLMVHPLKADLDAEAAYACAESLFEENIERIGSVSLLTKY
jgi:GNAT superfamily N-acetyltransferase